MTNYLLSLFTLFSLLVVWRSRGTALHAPVWIQCSLGGNCMVQSLPPQQNCPLNSNPTDHIFSLFKIFRNRIYSEKIWTIDFGSKGSLGGTAPCSSRPNCSESVERNKLGGTEGHTSLRKWPHSDFSLMFSLPVMSCLIILTF